MKFLKVDFIKKLLAKTCTKDELKNLFIWLNSERGQQEILQELDENWKSFEPDKEIFVNSKKIFENIKNGIKQREARTLKYAIVKRLSYAAIVFVLVGLASVLYYYNYTSLKKTQTEYASVVVENGQRSKIVLPDSTIIWVNSGSTISYNSDFAQKSREVYLTGQAYFHVAKNKNMPLRVHCKDIIVKVLGTKFDVNAYPDHPNVKVVLESGSVQLFKKNVDSFNYRLKPGELADIDSKRNTVNIRRTDSNKYTSWRNGILIFRNDPMTVVIDKLERWYNIKIKVEDPEVYQTIFNATIQNESFEKIFELMKFSCPVNYRIIKSSPGAIPEVILTKK